MSHPTKTCSKCGEEKPVECFSARVVNKDGLQTQCKECINEGSKRHYAANKESIDAKHRDYYRKNSEKVLKNQKRYEAENRTMIVTRRRNRRHSDPAVAMLHRLRSRLNTAINRAGADKTDYTLRLLGCTAEEFKKHIESQFIEGMGWDNRDKWHIDHLRPCASFDLLQESEQRKCFHYTNLQPLWAKDNLSKGCKYDGE
jgi:hypothetical protein